MTIESYTRQVLYDVEWQTLRVSLLGFWGERGTVEIALDKVVGYAQGEPRGVRVWRGLNLLNGVLLSYGDSRPYHWVKVKQCRDMLKRESLKYPVETSDTGFYWSWSKVTRDLRTAGEITLIRIKRDLQGRVRRVQLRAKNRKRGYDPQLVNTRPELIKFLTLINVELGVRNAARAKAVPG